MHLAIICESVGPCHYYNNEFRKFDMQSSLENSEMDIVPISRFVICCINHNS